MRGKKRISALSGNRNREHTKRRTYGFDFFHSENAKAVIASGRWFLKSYVETQIEKSRHMASQADRLLWAKETRTKMTGLNKVYVVQCGEYDMRSIVFVATSVEAAVERLKRDYDATTTPTLDWKTQRYEYMNGSVEWRTGFDEAGGYKYQIEKFELVGSLTDVGV